jgi:hypothetical protein
MNSKPLMIMPAYGRQYKTSEQAKADWNAGKDFKIVNGPYLSIRDVNYLKSTYSSVWLDLITLVVRVV